MALLKRFEPEHPCEDGSQCLVKASCRIPSYRRETDCEIYKTYLKKSRKFESLSNAIGEIIFHSIFWPVIIFIVGTFVLGILKEWLYIKEWFF